MKKGVVIAYHQSARCIHGGRTIARVGKRQLLHNEDASLTQLVRKYIAII